MATEIAMSPDLPTPSLARRITSGLTVLGLTLFLVTFVVPWVTGTAPWGGLGALSLLVPIAVLTLGGFWCELNLTEGFQLVLLLLPLLH